MSKNTRRFFRIVTTLVVLSVSGFSLPASALNIETWKTKNGVEVLFVETHALPMLDVRLNFKAGSARDDEKYGISSLVNGLLVEGSADLTAEQVAEGFESVGAQLGHDSLRDMAWLSLRTLTDKEILEQVGDLFALVAAQPSFPDKAIERDRKAMLVNLENRKKEIDPVAEDAFFIALYDDHPYAVAKEGTRETLEGINRTDLKTFHERYYSAANATLALVGDLTLSQAKAYAERLTARLKPGKKAVDLPVKGFPEQGKTIRIPFKTTQAHLMVGQPVMSRKDPDYYALYLGNHVLGGGGFNSRLMKEIRSKRGLVYSVYSYFIPMDKSGPFQMALQTKKSQAGEALQILDQMLKEFIQNGPTEEEVQHAKKNITGSFPLKIDSNKKIVEYLALIGFYDLPLDYLDSFNQRIEAVTIEQIKDAFKRRVDPDRLIKVVAGEKAP